MPAQGTVKVIGEGRPLALLFVSLALNSVSLGSMPRGAPRGSPTDRPLNLSGQFYLTRPSKFFNRCVERDVLDVAPTAGVRPPSKETARERALSDDEVRWFWRACEQAGQPWGSLGQLLLLTGQRRSEVAQMTEAEIRPGHVWHLSAERTKNKRAHDVPLSLAAQAVLAGVERIAGPQGYIFTTTGQTPVSGFGKAQERIAQAMENIASRERGQPARIPRWTFHDLRRTAATGMARLGIAVRVSEAVLNHVSGTGGGIVAVYQRHDFADEKRQALEAWGQFVAELVNERAVSRRLLPNA